MSAVRVDCSVRKDKGRKLKLDLERNLFCLGVVFEEFLFKLGKTPFFY